MRTLIFLKRTHKQNSVISTRQYINLSTMNNQLAKKVVEKLMQDDLFSQWLKLEVIEITEGHSKIKMQLRNEMINGFNVIHGGIIFALADSAFAFASNNRNNLSMALDCSISFNKASKPGDTLTAEAKEIHNGKSTGLYIITIINQNSDHVALFKGTCFRVGKTLV
jgi:acyl-CoA thioesterase